MTAARRPIHGADRVARFLLGIASKAPKDQRLLPVTVNGDLGLALLDAEQPVAIAAITVQAGRIQRVDLALAPDNSRRSN